MDFHSARQGIDVSTNICLDDLFKSRREKDA